jgi:hypothetical protein
LRQWHRHAVQARNRVKQGLTGCRTILALSYRHPIKERAGDFRGLGTDITCGH